MHEGSKLYEGTRMHGSKIARRQKCTRGLTKLHEGTKMHEDYFAQRVKIARLSVLHGDNCAQNNTNLKQLSKNFK